MLKTASLRFIQNKLSLYIPEADLIAHGWPFYNETRDSWAKLEDQDDTSLLLVPHSKRAMGSYTLSPAHLQKVLCRRINIAHTEGSPLLSVPVGTEVTPTITFGPNCSDMLVTYELPEVKAQAEPEPESGPVRTKFDVSSAKHFLNIRPHHIYQDKYGSFCVVCDSKLENGGVSVNEATHDWAQQQSRPVFFQLKNKHTGANVIRPMGELIWGNLRESRNNFGKFYIIESRYVLPPQFPPFDPPQDAGQAALF